MKNDKLESDIIISELKSEIRALKKDKQLALSKIKEDRKNLAVSKNSEITTGTITLRAKGKSEATAIMVASDWHIEEVIRPGTVNGLNKYNPVIAKQRAERFFRNGLSLVQMCQKDVEINKIVFPILGDMISSNIHDELKENNSMLPLDAVMYVQNLLATGIQFLLNNFKGEIIIPCHSGNHGRITHKIHHSTENGNSLEFYMFNNLSNHFRDEKRVKFLISTGYHSYVKIYNYTIRFHHGHKMRYGGGVGGLYIPVNKAIAQWNRLKTVNLDVFGHFHQFRDGGNFISNGSLVGYNPYALSIKADYEPPRQAYFLVDKKRGKTIVCPILLNE